MKKNIGTAEKIIRILVALVIAVLYITDTVSGTFGLILSIVGILMATTALFSFCPLYVPFKLSTRKSSS